MKISFIALLIITSLLFPHLATAKNDFLEHATALMQGHFMTFPEVPLHLGNKPDGFTRIDPYSHSIKDDNDYRFIAFRFKTPEEINGSFHWLFLLDKSASKQTYQDMSWAILEEDEQMEGFTHFWKGFVGMTDNLFEEFPYTRNYIDQPLALGYLKPNRNYLIWFHVKDGPDLPPLAVMLVLAESIEQNPKSFLPIPKERHNPTYR
ncbi:MAG: hypothetical protein ACSHX8_03350 [Opitutaceae bacterium]